MKAFATALGICALLVTSANCFATAYMWDGAPGSAWNNGYNWHTTPITNFPNGIGDSATIDDTYSASAWPVLDQDRTIGQLVMHDGVVGDKVQINTSTYDLTIDNTTLSGQFEISDSDSETYVEKLGTGTIYCAEFVVQADDENSATVKVSAGEITTVEPE